MELEKLALGEKKEYPEWDIKDLTLMSPGPTQVAPNVRKVRSYNVSSPIVDKRFFDFYKETCEKMAQILRSEEHTSELQKYILYYEWRRNPWIRSSMCFHDRKGRPCAGTR